MISQHDLYRSANLMIQQFGEDAEIEAARQADQKLTAGDRAGLAYWLQIKRVVGELQSSPSGNMH